MRTISLPVSSSPCAIRQLYTVQKGLEAARCYNDAAKKYGRER
jgi:hypothetical protein